MSSAVLCTALILDFPSQKNYTPLHLAALSKKHLVAQLLIGHGADVTVIGGLVRLILFVCFFVCQFYATFCEIFRSERSECALVKFTSHDNYEKINSWVSFNFHIWDACGAPLGGPSGRRSSAINFDWVVRFQGMVTKTKKVKMAADSNEEKQTRLWASFNFQLFNFI